jgi:hypothetical protein
VIRAALSRIAFGVVLGLACSSCSSCEKKSDDKGAIPEVPVAAPIDLLADVYAISPNTSWSKLQRGIGGAVGILPATLPGIIGFMADMDPRIANEIDGSAPIYGVLAGDPAHPGFCIAMKLVDPRRARMLLTDGETAVFNVREEPSASGQPGLTHLVPKVRVERADKKQPSAAALTSNGYITVGPVPEELSKLAPYTTRTLPSRTMPKDAAIVADVPRSAVEKVLAPKLEGAWTDAKGFLLAEDERMRGVHGGRAPDFGDPKAIVAALDAVVGRRIAVFRDLERVRFALDVNDDAVVLDATLTPVSGDGPAKKWVSSMRVGDAASLLGLPSTSLVAISLRDTEEDRVAQATEMEKAIASSLGERLKEPDAKKLHDALDDWTKGRDETLAIAYSIEEPAGTFVTTRARDAEAANRAVRSIVDLTKVSPFKEMLHVKEVTTTTEDFPGFGKVQIAKLAREAPAAHKPPPGAKAPPGDAGAAMMAGPPAGVAWSTEGGTVALALGAEPLVTFKTSARPDKKLRDDPLVARFTTNVGATASTFVVVQPLRFDAKRAHLGAAPVAAAVSRKESDAIVRLEISDALLRELSRYFMGF